MNIEFEYALGEVVRTKRNEIGKVVALSVTEGRTTPFFKSCRIELDDGSQYWVPEFRIDDVVS